MKSAPMRMDTEINCRSPRRNNQLNPNKYNMVIAKYTVIKLHNATHDTNMEKGPLKKKNWQVSKPICW